MGLFKRRKKPQEEETTFQWMTVGEALSREKMKNGQVSFEEVMERCEECCEQYADAFDSRREVEDEYQAITSYLQDIEKIDLLAPEPRKEIEEIAQTIIRLNDERVHYQEDEKERITPAQFLQMERFEGEVPVSLQHLTEQEAYRDIVNGDIRHLEGEKGALAYEKEEGERRLSFFKNLSIVCVAMVCLLFMVLFYLMESFELDLTLAFLVTGLLALAMAAYIVTSIRKTRYSMAVADKKMNKAILLMNKVKIKYVNCTNAIDYLYEKFGISSRRELEYLWEQYQKVKADRERYRKNTERLEAFNKALTAALKQNGIVDAEIWVYQPEAILDSKEMVEVRHHMNERRRTVRDRMDYAGKHFDLSRDELEGLVNCFPQYEHDIRAMMRKYGIEPQRRAEEIT